MLHNNTLHIINGFFDRIKHSTLLRKFYMPATVIIICFCNAACGVKTVGDNVAAHVPSGLEKAAYDPIDARYPAFGTRTERRLYLMNHPSYFQAQQNYVEANLKSQFTGKSMHKMLYSTDQDSEIMNVDDNFDHQPRSVSPFR